MNKSVDNKKIIEKTKNTCRIEISIKIKQKKRNNKTKEDIQKQKNRKNMKIYIQNLRYTQPCKK